jgi:cell wall-associated NlpC family hydrolase
MPIKRLTAFFVLSAALLVIAPVQATTSKTQAKSLHPKHAQQHPKSAHVKSARHQPAHAQHGKLAAAKHKTTHSNSAASNASAVDADTPDMADAVMGSELSGSGSLQGKSFAVGGFQAIADVTPQLLTQPPIFNPAPMLAQSIVPADGQALLAGRDVAARPAAANRTVDAKVEGDEPAAVADGNESATDLRKSLIAMAMKMRDIRYVRGGHDPSTGFDCSGFVRYVFAHAIGLQLPNNSASQFLAGLKVKRSDMKPGDLVFFRTHGKQRISHVGIYISEGRFIHSPASGKSVEISSLDEVYWAKRFAGAKRPEAMALAAVDKG